MNESDEAEPPSRSHAPSGSSSKPKFRGSHTFINATHYNDLKTAKNKRIVKQTVSTRQLPDPAPESAPVPAPTQASASDPAPPLQTVPQLPPSNHASPGTHPSLVVSPSVPLAVTRRASRTSGDTPNDGDGNGHYAVPMQFSQSSSSGNNSLDPQSGHHTSANTSIPGDVSHLPQRPISLIATPFTDKQNTLLGDHDVLASSLFYVYMNGELLDPSWTSLEHNKAQFKREVVDIRYNTWYPLIRGFKAPHYALLTLVISTPGLQIYNQQAGYRFYYEQAWAQTNTLLNFPRMYTSDIAMVSVVLLMVACQRNNDLIGFRLHAVALKDILRCRREVNRTGQPRVAPAHCFDVSDAALTKRSGQRYPKDAFDLSPERKGEFYGLHQLSLVSAKACCFYAFAATLLALGLETGNDQLVASFTAGHIFLESLVAEEAPPEEPFEMACLAGFRLVLHCLCRPLRSEDDPLTVALVNGIFWGLLQASPRGVGAACPLAVVWLGLVAGSQANRSTAMRPQRGLLGDILRPLKRECGSFEGVIRRLEEEFLWAPAMTEDACAFWAAI